MLKIVVDNEGGSTSPVWVLRFGSLRLALSLGDALVQAINMGLNERG